MTDRPTDRTPTATDDRLYPHFLLGQFVGTVRFSVGSPADWERLLELVADYDTWNKAEHARLGLPVSS